MKFITIIIWVILTGSEVFATELSTKQNQQSFVAPVLELKVDPDVLYNLEHGILANPESKGPDWERPARLIVWIDGIMSEIAVGIRLHGGASRKYPIDNPLVPAKSIRIYGRNELDPRAIGVIKNLLPKAVRNRKEFIIRRDPKYRNFMATQVAGRVGAETPYIMPTFFYLNGVYQGEYTIAERLKLNHFLKDRSDSGVLPAAYKFKSDSNSPETKEVFRKIEELLLEMDSAALRTWVNANLDLEAFFAHLFSIAYCGTTDWRQGIAYRNASSEQKWRFVNWDMDHSFHDIANRKGTVEPREAWEQESEELFSSGIKWWKPELVVLPYARRDLRTQIFMTIAAANGIYRKEWLGFSSHTIREKLTEEFFADNVLAKIEAINAVVDEGDRISLRKVRDFFRHRGAHLLEKWY